LKKIKPSFIPAITWFIISVILLTLPGSSFPKENWFDMIWLDKWIHIGMFSILVILWCWAMLKKYADAARLRTIFIYIGLIGLAYGIGMEFVQKYFIPNRAFEIKDMIADGIGAAFGVIFSIIKFRKK
jgi:VanZ family protein